MSKCKVLMIFSLIVFMGCSMAKMSPDAVKFAIDFSWEGVKKCSKSSPEIRINTIPAGTEYFEVKLKDIDVPNWNHGGGRVDNDGSGIIPAGVLTDHYNGPCPPPNIPHSYQFIVRAFNAEDVIIGVGKAMKKYPLD